MPRLRGRIGYDGHSLIGHPTADPEPHPESVMKDQAEPLDDDELDELDGFLFDRVDPDQAGQGRNPGIVCISELDGFLTAVVSGPVLIPPSRWLPVVWGDFEPEFEGIEDFQRVFSLMIRHMNGIVGTLMDEPEDFEPVVMERERDGKTDAWCFGYMKGVDLASDDWDEGGKEMKRLLLPMIYVGHAGGVEELRTQRGTEGLPELTDERMEALKELIVPSVRAIHAYWLERRDEMMPSHRTPVRHAAPKVGRNDPCPCGSGKKYKKCCLQ